MSDSHVEVESVSFFGQLKSAIGGVVTGFVLIPVACSALLWNECRSADRYKDLEEGAGAVVSVDGGKVDKGNDGKLVHFTADAKVDGKIKDKKFGVEAEAIKLVRETEIYQWVENKKTETKGDKKKTTYTYEKKWSDEPVSSSNFKKKKGHSNSSDRFVKGETVKAKDVTVGGYEMSDTFISKFTKTEAMELSKKKLAKIKEKMSDAKLNGDFVYLGEDPDSPAIGDVRVTFKVALPETVSLIGKQSGKKLSAHKTKTGNELAELRYGKMTADEMFAAAESDNFILTWILRIVGLFFIFGGLMAIFRPLTVVSDRIPLIGGVISSSVALFAGVVSFGITLGVVSVGWIIARPMLGLGLCLCSLTFFGILIGLGVTMAKKKKAE